MLDGVADDFGQHLCNPIPVADDVGPSLLEIQVDFEKAKSGARSLSRQAPSTPTSGLVRRWMGARLPCHAV